MELVTIGDINWDTVILLPRFPGPDDEVELSEIYESPGGDAANVAVAFSRLGGKAGIIGAVGTDTVGESLISHLNRHGVDITRVLLLKGPSGRAYSLVEPNGIRRIFYTHGVFKLRKFSDEDLKYVRNINWLYIADPLPETIQTVANWYKTNPTMPSLVLDPGSAGAARGLGFFSPLYAYIDVLLLNEFEALTITKKTRLDDAIYVLTSNYPLVVIKRGEKGALVAYRNEIFSVPAFPVKAVDTTGCGDSFNAAFLYALTKGKSLQEAATWGNAAGALVAQHPGAYAPRRDEIEELLAKFSRG
ncbi:MAG: carbohydrate kinase family protein [Candidatus Hadarchaeum sp.]